VTRYDFPYIPGPASGDWSVELPAPTEGDLTSIGEVIVYAEPFAVPPTSYGAIVLSDTPLHYWPAPYGTGLPWTDLGTGPIDLTAGTIPPGTVAGPDGVAVADWPDSLTYIAQTVAATDFPAGNITVEAWVNPDTISAIDTVLVRTNVSDTTSELKLLLDGGLPALLLYSTVSTTSDFAFAYADTAVPTGDWSHIVGTWDGTDMHIYLDGADVTDTSNGPFDTQRSGVSQPWTVGRYPFPSGAAGSHPGDGGSAHVAVYDYALSAGRVAAHFAAMTP